MCGRTTNAFGIAMREAWRDLSYFARKFLSEGVVEGLATRSLMTVHTPDTFIQQEACAALEEP